MPDSPLKIYTIGHSTRPIEEFIEILQAYEIEMLVDVRTLAGSRHNPQYNGENLSQSLEDNGISYLHMKGLGGLRKTSKDSVNLGWKNPSFRGYADYMQAPEFADNLQELIEIAKQKRTVIMCAEAVPWRCHRSLIGDALSIRNIVVEDILSKSSSSPHRMTRFAKVAGTSLTYPAETLE